MARLKEVIVELTKQNGLHPKGARYELPSVAQATRIYGDDYKVVSYADGTPYEAKDDAPGGRSPAADQAARRGADKSKADEADKPKDA